MLRTLLLVAAALIAAMLWGLVLGAASEAAPAVAAPDHLIGTSHHEGPDATAEGERGPPATTYDHTTPTSAVDAASYGPSARPDPAGTLSYTYDHTARCAPRDNAGVTTWTTSAGNAVEVRSVPGARCAAKAGSSRVNPLGGTQNCVYCAIAGDNTLAGFPTSALDTAGPQLISRIEQHFGASFKAVGGRSDITDILANAGPGARGIVFGARGSDPGHVFNAINQGGVVRYIDFQTGRAASFNGYSGFSFLRTN